MDLCVHWVSVDSHTVHTGVKLIAMVGEEVKQNVSVCLAIL